MVEPILVAALAQRLHGVERARDHLGIVGQARQLQRNEFLEHGLDVAVVGQAVMLLLPAPAHGLEHWVMRSIWTRLCGAHGRARLLQADRHALAPEHLDEDDGRRDAAEIHGGAGPVQQHGLQLATVAAMIAECHFLCPSSRSLRYRPPGVSPTMNAGGVTRWVNYADCVHRCRRRRS